MADPDEATAPSWFWAIIWIMVVIYIMVILYVYANYYQAEQEKMHYR